MRSVTHGRCRLHDGSQKLSALPAVVALTHVAAPQADSQRRKSTMNGISRLTTTALVSGGLGLAGLGLGAGTAQAIPVGGDQWCPGQPPLRPELMQQLAQLPGGLSICQDWYFGADGNAVGGDPGPGKPPNMFPMQVSAPPAPWTPPPYCPPWATIFSGPAECSGL
jgi:hypothetical protein